MTGGLRSPGCPSSSPVTASALFPVSAMPLRIAMDWIGLDWTMLRTEGVRDCDKKYRERERERFVSSKSLALASKFKYLSRYYYYCCSLLV